MLQLEFAAHQLEVALCKVPNPHKSNVACQEHTTTAVARAMLTGAVNQASIRPDT